MSGLLVPLLIADAILAWMLRETHRRRDRTPGAIVRGRDVNAMMHWFTVGRIALLLALSLIGTIAVWRA